MHLHLHCFLNTHSRTRPTHVRPVPTPPAREQHYNQPAGFAAPTALLLLKLVGGRSSHVALDVLWQAVLGVTDQHQRQRLPEAEYEV